MWGPTPSREGRIDASVRPLWMRGRVLRLLHGLYQYARIAWWGLVSPRVSASRPLVIVQAVIAYDEQPTRVLLAVRSDLLGWELPGGTPEGDESPQEALVREVLEETGLQVEPVAHVGDWVRTGFRPHTARVHRCRVLAGVETPSHETPRLGWFDAEALPAGLLPWYREPLHKAFATGESPARVEEHQGLGWIWSAMKIDLGMRWRGLPLPAAITPGREGGTEPDETVG